MEMKYYNPSNNFRAPIPREPKPYSPPVEKRQERFIPAEPEKSKETKEQECKEGIVHQKSRPEADELLIMGVILVLLANQCEDYLLLAALAFLLFSGKEKRNE
ncbi:MAG: hypothetical protein E7418_00530 [Ruminococcaceae bacterium]|nr:hypothetical protein [Oscillospiraceae bacterium]